MGEHGEEKKRGWIGGSGGEGVAELKGGVTWSAC